MRPRGHLLACRDIAANCPRDTRHGSPSRGQRCRRRRGAGRPHAGARPRLARHRRGRARDPARRRAAQREVQSGLGPLDGDLSAARPRRPDPCDRAAARISQRRVVLHLGDRAGALAHPAAVARRPHARRDGRRRLVADRRVSPPHQPAVSRAAAVRARRRAAAHPHPQPHALRELHRRCGRRHRARRGSRRRRARHAHRPLPGRLRRRTLDGAPRHRRGASRHPGGAARAVDLFSRAQADRPAAGRARLDVSRLQPAPLRHHDGDRRPRTLADPQFPLPRRDRHRGGRSRSGRSATSSASARSSTTR